MARIGTMALSLFRLPVREQVTMVRVATTAAVVEALLRTRRLPDVARLLGVGLAWSTAGTGAPFVPGVVEQRHMRCARRVMRHWRLANGPCLREALVVGHLLRRHRPVLVVGVAREPTVAHAWLEIGDCRLGMADGFEALHA